MYYFDKNSKRKKNGKKHALLVFNSFQVCVSWAVGLVWSGKRCLGARAYVIVDIDVICWPPGNITMLTCGSKVGVARVGLA